MLDVAGVNEKLREVQRLEGAELEAELNEIQNNLRGYVDQHFIANRFQRRVLDGFPTGEWLFYGAEIANAIRNGHTVTAEPVEGDSPAARAKCPKITITITLQWL